MHQVNVGLRFAFCIFLDSCYCFSPGTFLTNSPRTPPTLLFRTALVRTSHIRYRWGTGLLSSLTLRTLVMDDAASCRIHPTVLISPQAEIAPDVRIGPFVVIEGPVTIGAGCVLRPRAHLIGPLTMGRNNTVY